MRLMQLAEVPTSSGDRVFRYSPARALGVAGVVTCASVGLLLAGWQRHSGLAYYVAGVLVVGLVVMHKFILARLQPSNWLVQLSDQGMFVQFRSYLNYRLPPQDPTVVHVPYAEMRSARLVREARDIPYRDENRLSVERTTVQRRRWVEFELAGDSGPLGQALAAEAARRPQNATLYRHYPVRMASASLLQVEWGVVPGPEVFLNALRSHVNIATSADLTEEYAHLAGLNREEQAKRLLELAETGQTIAAVYIARKLYSYDLTQAHTFIEGLRARKAGGAGRTDTVA